jgi:hypothetical protein
MTDPFGVTVKIDARLAQERLGWFGQKQVNTVLAQAANKAAQGMRSAAAKLIRERVGMLTNKADVIPRFRLDRADPQYPVSEISIGRREIGLIRYVRNQRPPKRKPKIGVDAKVFNVKTIHPGTFFVEVAPGRWQVFKRRGRGRTPIERMYGPTVAGVARIPAVYAELERIASGLLDKHLDDAINRRLRVLTGRAKLAAAAQAKFDRAG